MSLLSRLAVGAARAYGALAISNRISADYLVVAGGGSGGGLGGGGAGGLLTSTATLSTLNTYSITVGAGGAPFTGQKGNNGSNSSISGTGLSTVTSTGGGGGGGFDSPNQNGNSGGSGGGGGCGANGPLGTGGAGTSGQGFAGGNPVSASPTIGNGAGGGGAGAVGSNSPGSTTGGNGGAGTSSSISGSSVTYAGGGGGGAYILSGTGTAGTGGSGGGGNGGRNGLNPTAGSANTGGGGGGAGLSSAGALNTAVAGGSGIVIISYTSATPKFVGGTITTSGGKQIHTFTSSGTLSPITPITASYLVVAGGGGGAQGGGGAGGLLTSSTTLYSGATYVVTVGAGGTGGPPTTTGSQTNGSDSILSGTGLTTLTAVGGGFGGRTGGGNGNTGGSGGGGAYATNGGAGTSGQGFAGGNGGGASSAGGGGGSSAVGSAGSGSTGGNGGAGTASSITGTSVTYAGGGGGAANTTAGSGGAGGGGSGGVSTTNGGAGTPNLGGGGGGGGATSSTGGNGGSGTVIISYAGSQVFNGGLVTTSGGNTIHTFTSTGALTPLTNNLNNSLRFRSSASAYLNRTPTVAGNRRTWTWSAWIKLGRPSDFYALFGSTNNCFIGYGQSTGGANLGIADGNTSTMNVQTTALFRDPSAWYHFVVALDTTQATAANRVKIYVNGNQQTAFVASTYPSQNAEFNINNTTAQNIGRTWDGFQYFDGYMTDINFIDGQALEPYYFGNNDANGVWKPIQYKGTYGTNGFYLNFSNTTSTTTLGFDSSPNGNNWTTNNISLTAGVTYDAMTDVPTNTSATAANYCVLSPLDSQSVAPQQANSYVPATDYAFVRGTFWVSTGKWYYEWTSSAGGGLPPYVGVAAANITSYLGVSTSGISWYGHSDALLKPFTATSSISATALASGDIVGVAFDCDAGTIRYYKNNTLVYTDSTLTAGTLVSPVLLSTFGGGAWNNATFNFGQRPFAYTPPTGHVALNTFNLPTPTILQGNKYMDATLYSGNDTTNVIVNQARFKPDLVWIKARNAVSYYGLIDSVRGRASVLFSNATDSQGTSTSTQDLVSFNSNGFTLDNDAQFNCNSSGSNLVAWQWQANQGTNTSNTSGTITSTVSVNTTAGFSIVTWTGNGTIGATVGHGLGVTPSMIIVKQRNGTEAWPVYHISTGATKYTDLSNTAATATSITRWNNTAPSSTVITLYNDAATNGSSSTYVAYCFAAISGFSAFGSYTGNGSADGPFVYTGFRPKFVMIKRTDSTGSWFMVDTSRNTYNLTDLSLYANLTDAEGASTSHCIDILSNGFKARGTGTNINANGSTYIYATFAENPFKNANAR